ncbi:MAG: pentapeptide repeat-containing protein, partial [Ktedonobacteraceae bacterium]
QAPMYLPGFSLSGKCAHLLSASGPLSGSLTSFGRVMHDLGFPDKLQGAYLEETYLIRAHLEHANLFGAHLRKARLIDAVLKSAILNKAQLDDADIMGGQLEYAKLWEAQLKNADFAGAYLDFANFEGANLEGAQLNSANFNNAKLVKANLNGANLRATKLDEANLSFARLKKADLFYAQLKKAVLSRANLEGAKLIYARLPMAVLDSTNLTNADLRNANLKGADLLNTRAVGVDFREANLSGASLNDFILGDKNHTGPYLVDVEWGKSNLALADWSQISTLGDEYEANQQFYTLKDISGPRRLKKDKESRLNDYKNAVRAYNQLSIALRAHGLNEDASRLTYRAHLMQRKVYWYKHKIWSWAGSLFLYLVSGYGYKVGRCFTTYALVIGLFALIYLLLGTHLMWNEAIVISMTAFHGRGFFPEQFKPGDPQAMVAAIEAFVGLLIEVTFIATLTQRLFGR